MIRSLRTLVCTLFALTAMAWAGAACAEITVTAPAATPNLGKMIQGSGSTSFTIGTDGSVTRTAGTGIRLSSANVTAPTVNVTCGLLNLSSLCVLRYMRITVTPNTGAGPVSVTQLRVSNLSGASYSVAPVAGSTVTFVLNPIALTPISFKVGMDVTVASGATGDQSFGYTVTADFLP